MQAGDRISVYPAFTTLDINSAAALRPPISYPVRFLLDNHLGRLARYLRLLGFDTLYFNNRYDDAQLAQMAEERNCILLSRDRGLLKRSQVVYGFWLRSKEPEEQLRAVLHRYGLGDEIRPWRRCLRCNGTLQAVDKEKILQRLEPKTRLHYDEFHICGECEQIYWKGSHFEKLESFINGIVSGDSERENRG